MRPVIIRDDDDFPPRERQGRTGRRGFGFIVALLLLLVLGARSIAGFVIELEWWKEVGQLETWFSMLGYRLLPLVAAVLIFAVLWLAHARGVRHGGARLRDYRGYARLATVAIALLSLFLAAVAVDAWTVVRYAGGAGAAAATGWHDPVFGKPLSFYLFELPFYRMLLGLVLTTVIAAMLVYWFAARGFSLRERFRDLRGGGDLDIRELRLGELLESQMIRVAAAIGLCVLAARIYLGRYNLLNEDHGFMVGLDYVGETILLPLVWAAIAACVAGAAMILIGRLKSAAILVVAALILPSLIAKAVSWAYVRPNEISIQRPYIERHIAGTRAAYGLDKRTREVEFAATLDAGFDQTKHREALDNVRLWDWQAFHDTVTQIQALRPYYVFPDSDEDRYMLPDKDGKVRMQQVLLTPRELDVRQLGAAGWLNQQLIYTHGYGVVMAEANRITPDGLPLLFIQNAPPEVKTRGLKLTRPEIYYGEAVHEPVFVRTAREEFNYPAGSENKHNRYDGRGGFPISSYPMKLAAAVHEGAWNILLTPLLTGESRMMIRRKVADRLEALAGFLHWDEDPYLVVTDEGRLVWIADGYTSSNSHPYSRSLRSRQMGSLNYIRNSVKATVDAYDGTVTIYIFDPSDPIVLAYSKLFPRLFRPASDMPADLRAHARYPEMIFRVQAEIYRIFHMTNPESFYNKEDLWDVARNVGGQESASAEPTYVVSNLPDSDESEFLLMIPFTPRNKDNLIGIMVARCDGDRLGEIVFLQLSKQELVFGPMQIKARINQDQNIARDLNMWNQQGSKVIRGQMLVLPIGKTFLYVEPIYLQAAQAPMPQLRKVALASGSQIAYADTYEQALSQLGVPATREFVKVEPPKGEAAAGAAPPPGPDRRVEDARSRLRRYRDLMSQGKFAEAGKELEALQDVLK